MNGAPIADTNTEVPALFVEANYDEDITSGDNFSKINEYRNDMEINIE